jgi:hypothetical protein
MLTAQMPEFTYYATAHYRYPNRQGKVAEYVANLVQQISASLPRNARVVCTF